MLITLSPLSRPARLVAIAAALFLFTACASGRPRPVPGLPPAYKVMGTWYQPISDPTGFTQRGVASWYGPNFHGKTTANGEIYDMHAMTAAHTTLPLGTRVRVRNLENDNEVVVRINDRGPFVKQRIIDLSLSAAKALGLVGHGTARVEITALTASPASVGSSKKPDPSNRYTVQVASFTQKSNAESLVNTLAKDHKHVFLVPESNGFKVRVGQFSNRHEADKAKARLAELGYSSFIVNLN